MRTFFQATAGSETAMKSVVTRRYAGSSEARRTRQSEMERRRSAGDGGRRGDGVPRVGVVAHGGGRGRTIRATNQRWLAARRVANSGRTAIHGTVTIKNRKRWEAEYRSRRNKKTKRDILAHTMANTTPVMSAAIPVSRCNLGR